MTDAAEISQGFFGWIGEIALADEGLLRLDTGHPRLPHPDRRVLLLRAAGRYAAM